MHLEGMGRCAAVKSTHYCGSGRIQVRSAPFWWMTWVQEKTGRKGQGKGGASAIAATYVFARRACETRVWYGARNVRAVDRTPGFPGSTPVRASRQAPAPVSDGAGSGRRPRPSRRRPVIGGSRRKSRWRAGARDLKRIPDSLRSGGRQGSPLRFAPLRPLGLLASRRSLRSRP